jgi:hypothetical protein
VAVQVSRFSLHDSSPVAPTCSSANYAAERHFRARGARTRRRTTAVSTDFDLVFVLAVGSGSTSTQLRLHKFVLFIQSNAHAQPCRQPRHDTMDFDWDNWNQDEPPAPSEDPILPLFIEGGGAYGSFGDLFNGDTIDENNNMRQSATLPWTLDEVGYTYAAPHVYADGRIDRALHPPDYYAYFTPTSSWSDGLQEIEDFDWSDGKNPLQDAIAQEQAIKDREDIPAAETSDTPSQATSLLESSGKESEQETLTQQDKVQNRENFTDIVPADSPDATGLARSLDLVDGDAMDAEETIPRLYAQLDDEALRLESIPITASNAFAPEVTPTDASHMPFVSPPWIPDPIHGSLAAAAATKPNVQASNIDSGDQNAATPEQMDVDDNRTTQVIEAEEETSTKGPDRASADAPDSEEEEPTAEAAQDNKSIGNDLGSDVASKTASVLTELVVLPDVPVHKSSESEHVFERPSMVPEALSNTITSEDVVAAHGELKAPSPLLAEDVPEAPEATTAPSQSSTQESPGPGAVHGPSMLPEAHRDTNRSEDRGPAISKPALPLPLQAENIQLKQYKIIYHQPKTDEEPAASQLASEAPANLAALASADDDHEKPCQVQLQQTALDLSSGGLSDLLPPGYSEGLGDTATTDMDEESLQASLSVANAVELPPYPFQPDIDAMDDREELQALGVQNEEIGTQQADVTSQSESEVHWPIVDNGDEMTVDDLESGPIAINGSEVPAEEPIGDKVEINPNVDSTDSMIVDKSEPSPPPSKSKAKVANPHKRSRPTKKAKNTSETDEEASIKKKQKKAAAAKSGTSRAKKTEAADEQEDGTKTPPLKRQRAATKSRKETATAHKTRGEPLSKPDETLSKFEHFAYGNYAHPDGQMTFGTEIEIHQPDYNDDDIDMEEHYTDVETPSPSKRDRYPVSNRELESLSVTKYRDRSSQARSCMGTEERFATSGSHPEKLNIFSTLMSSTSVLEESPSLVPRNDNSFMLIEPEDTSDANSTPKVTKHPGLPKSKAIAPKKTKQEATKTLATRPTRKKKVAPVEEEVLEEMQEEEEEDTPLVQAEQEKEPELFPASKIETQAAVAKTPFTAPPKMRASMGRTTRSKKKATKEQEEDAVPSAERKPLVDDVDNDDEQDEPDDAQDAFDPPADEKDDLSEDTEIAKVKQGTKKGNRLLAAVQEKSTSPAPSAVSSGTPGANKFGFTPPRGPKARQPRETAAAPASKSKLATKPKASAKGKVKARTSDVDAAPEASKQKPKTNAKGRMADIDAEAEANGDDEGAATEPAAKLKPASKSKAKGKATIADAEASNAALADTPTRVAQPAPKPRSKPKGTKSDLDASSEAPASAGASTVRQTRRASAREEEIRQAHEEAQVHEEMEARGKFKLKLRNKGVDEGV